MEHKNGSGSSEHLNLQFDVTSSIIDEDPLDHDKMVGCASSSSISSSHRLEVDHGENDTTFPEFEENGSNPESPSTTPKPSMISASPKAGGATQEVLPQTSDLNTLDASPKQSPPIQVMGHPSGYDPNRIPSSVFAPKRRHDSEWSLASNESLFSIHMGNDSFSMDSGFFISKSGEFDWFDDELDYSCFTPDANKSSDLTSMSPGLTPVMETTADNERKSASTNGESGEKEDIETHNASPIDPEGEKERLPSWKGLPSSSPCLTVPDEEGASPTDGPCNSATTARLSDASGHSTSSFAFPVLAERSKASPSTPKGAAEAETTPEAPSTTPKAGGNHRFNCFSCFPICC